MPQTIHIHPEAPPKPAWGAPCNGCGVCCLAEPCPLGMLLSRRRRGACVALRWADPAGRYECGALSRPVEVLGALGRLPVVRRWVARWIAAGRGCDAALEVERPPGP
ncbi:hypothetical protein [Aquabacterium sp. A08]|uniref:hypothetical protein n=1 Tax=Aquabacterium sp. A08 TaxID=2718532 RepID=UPI001421BD32|nr:hypothetical protein [Aquabacterium sp. A08]NIC41706.1 hypothetical protein [Aquabacterium sp. A08]